MVHIMPRKNVSGQSYKVKIRNFGSSLVFALIIIVVEDLFWQHFFLIKVQVVSLSSQRRVYLYFSCLFITFLMIFLQVIIN